MKTNKTNKTVTNTELTENVEIVDIAIVDQFIVENFPSFSRLSENKKRELYDNFNKKVNEQIEKKSRSARTGRTTGKTDQNLARIRNLLKILIDRDLIMDTSIKDLNGRIIQRSFSFVANYQLAIDTGINPNSFVGYPTTDMKFSYRSVGMHFGSLSMVVSKVKKEKQLITNCDSFSTTSKKKVEQFMIDHNLDKSSAKSKITQINQWLITVNCYNSETELLGSMDENSNQVQQFKKHGSYPSDKMDGVADLDLVDFIKKMIDYDQLVELDNSDKTEN